MSTFIVNGKRVKSLGVKIRRYPSNKRIKKVRGYKRVLLSVMLSVQYRDTTYYKSNEMNTNDKKILFNIQSKFRDEVLNSVLNRRIVIKIKSLGISISHHADDIIDNEFELSITQNSRFIKFDIIDINKGFEMVHSDGPIKVRMMENWRNYWRLLMINTNL